VPDGENALMHRVERPAFDALVHRLTSQAQASQLIQGDNPMLQPGDAPDLCVPPGTGTSPTGRIVGSGWTYRPVGVIWLVDEGSDCRDQILRLELDLSPGAAADTPARAHQILLTAPIRIEGRIGVVEPATVRLDDEAGIAPEKVGLVTRLSQTQGCIDLGPWQLCPAAERQEPSLQLAASPVGLGIEVFDQKTESGNAAAATIASDQVTEGRKVEDS